MAFCVNCGQEIPEGDKFCSNCGSAVEVKTETPKVEVKTPKVEVKTPKVEVKTSKVEVKRPKVKVKRPGPVFGVISLIVAIIGFRGLPMMNVMVMIIGGLFAIIFGIVAIVRKEKLKGIAIAGIVIGAVIFLLIFLGLLASNTNHSSTSGSTASSNAVVSKTNAPKGVDPDLVAFLDEYEALVDEYVDLMNRYYANPTDLNILSDYLDITERYASFAEKVDAYDSDSMSAADASYYLEVTTRCSQKMLKILDANE